MSFDSILNELLEDCPGAIGVALMGADGIPIAQAEAAGRADAADELALLGVEFGRMLDECRKAAAAAGAGALLELALRTERYHVLLQALDRETYLVLALEPEGNVGKGRYLLRRSHLAIREQL